MDLVKRTAKSGTSETAEAAEGAPLAQGISGSIESPDIYLQRYYQHYKPRTVDDLYFQLTRAIVLAARKWRKLANDRLREINQSQARWETLLMLSFSERDVLQSEMARRLSIEGPTLVRMLETLAEEGFIERRQNPQDRRVKINTLTAKGHAAVRDIKRITDALRFEALHDISLEDMATTRRVLSAFMERIEALDQEDVARGEQEGGQSA